MAHRLETHVRAGDTAARYGGDEFVIVADGLSGPELDAMIERLRRAVARPVDVDGTVVTVEMSVGRVAIPVDGEVTADRLIDAADAAMYRAKA